MARHRSAAISGTPNRVLLPSSDPTLESAITSSPHRPVRCNMASSYILHHRWGWRTQWRTRAAYPLEAARFESRRDTTATLFTYYGSGKGHVSQPHSRFLHRPVHAFIEITQRQVNFDLIQREHGIFAFDDLRPPLIAPAMDHRAHDVLMKQDIDLQFWQRLIFLHQRDFSLGMKCAAQVEVFISSSWAAIYTAMSSA